MTKYLKLKFLVSLLGVYQACSVNQDSTPLHVSNDTEKKFYHVFLQPSDAEIEGQQYTTDSEEKRKNLYIALGATAAVSATSGLIYYFNSQRNTEPGHGDPVRIRKSPESVITKVENTEANAILEELKRRFDPSQNVTNIAHISYEFSENPELESSNAINRLIDAQNGYTTAENRKLNAVSITPYFSFHENDPNFKKVFEITYPFNGKTHTSEVFIKEINGTFQFSIAPPNQFQNLGKMNSISDIDQFSELGKINFSLSSSALLNKLIEIDLPIHVVESHDGQSDFFQTIMRLFSEFQDTNIKRIHNTYEVAEAKKSNSFHKLLLGALDGIDYDQSILSSKSNVQFMDISNADFIIADSKKHIEALSNADSKKGVFNTFYRQNKKQFEVIDGGFTRELHVSKEALSDAQIKKKKSLLDTSFLSKFSKGQSSLHDTQKPIYLYLGKIESNDELSLLETAAKKLNNKGNIVVVTDETELNSKASKLAREKNVKFVTGADPSWNGGISKTIQQTADFMLQPSIKNNYGAVYLDGMLDGSVGFGFNQSGKVLDHSNIESAIENSLNLFRNQDRFQAVRYDNYLVGQKEALNRMKTKYLGEKIDLYNSIPKAKVFQVSKDGKTSTIRFPLTNSIGKEHDKTIFLKGLVESGYQVTSMNVDNSYVVDLNLHIELVTETKNGKKNWLMANQELLKKPHLKEVEKVLCRHPLCTEVVKKNLKAINRDIPVETIKFGSVLNKKAPSPTDFNRFFHPAGKSWMKNTYEVLEAWVEHPEWPELIVTCVDQGEWSCMNMGIKKQDKKLKKKLLEKVKKAGNIKIYDKYLDNDKFQEFRKIGFVVMPSEAEGFGHSIFESVGSGGIVLTTDEYPMKSHVRDGAGFAVKTKSKGKYRSGAPKVTFDKASFVDAVEKMRNLTPDRIAEMSQKGKDIFKQDKSTFAKQFSRLIRAL